MEVMMPQHQHFPLRF